MVARKLLIVTALVETPIGLMLLYNSVAVAVLANAGAVARLVGVLTWPAIALHAALAVWCIACLRSGWRVWMRRHA